MKLLTIKLIISQTRIKFSFDSNNEENNEYNELYDYLRFVRTHKSSDIFEFWKIYEERWSVLAHLDVKV